LSDQGLFFFGRQRVRSVHLSGPFEASMRHAQYLHRSRHGICYCTKERMAIRDHDGPSRHSETRRMNDTLASQRLQRRPSLSQKRAGVPSISSSWRSLLQRRQRHPRRVPLSRQGNGVQLTDKRHRPSPASLRLWPP